MEKLCRVNGVSLPCLADVFFGFGTTSGRCPFFKEIRGARVKAATFGGVCKRSYFLLRRFLVIVRMPQRYSAFFKLVTSFKNDDREREGNVKYRESQQITRFVGGRNYLVYWMVEA